MSQCPVFFSEVFENSCQNFWYQANFLVWENFDNYFRTFHQKVQEIDTNVKEKLKEHVILRKLASFIDFRFLHVCVQNTENFVFEIWEMVEKIKTDIDRQFFICQIKKSSILSTSIGKLFRLSKLKVVYVIFICSSISQISKTKFSVFWL